MAEIPGSFLRWGLFLFFAIIIAIVAVSWFINYPTIVTVPVTITTYNSPASLVVKSGGKIADLFTKNEGKVSARQSVALIENTAVWNDVLKLESIIETIDQKTEWKEVPLESIAGQNLSLGEIQSSYSRFISLFQQFKKYVKQSYITSKLDILEEQIHKQEEYTAELLNQKHISEEDLQLETNSYKRDSVLFYKSSYSISVNEFEKSKQALLQKKSSYSSLRASIKNNESSTLKMKETRLDLQVQLDKELYQYKLDLDEAFQLMNVAVDGWKEKYLIESPVDGKVTYTSYWNNNQVIKAGEVLATVIPDNASRIIIRAAIPASGLGRVRVGHEVNIKLSGFPYLEFGVLRGRIKSLSLVPVNDSYIAEIDLVNGLKTTYNKEIGFISEMTGTADIITDNSRLIFRLIKPLSSLIK